MRNFLLLFSLLVGLALFQNCKKSDSSIYNAKEIVPLSENNFWTYDNYYYTKPGKDSIHSADTITLQIGKIVKANNEYWHPFGFFIFTKEFHNMGTNRKNGFWWNSYEENQNVSTDSAWLFFKYPTKIGDEWYSKFDESILQTVSIDEEITVPVGTFKCIHYRRKDLSNYPNSGYFIAPGIGMIKFENFIGHHFEGPNPDTTWNILKLKRYKIK